MSVAFVRAADDLYRRAAVDLPVFQLFRNQPLPGEYLRRLSELRKGLGRDSERGLLQVDFNRAGIRADHRSVAVGSFLSGRESGHEDQPKIFGDHQDLHLSALSAFGHRGGRDLLVPL